MKITEEIKNMKCKPYEKLFDRYACSLRYAQRF